MSVDPHLAYRKCTDGLHTRSIGETTVLLHESWDEPMVLNAAMNVVWNSLQFDGSVEEITGDIVEVFGGTVENARTRVIEAFVQLSANQLIAPVAKPHN